MDLNMVAIIIGAVNTAAIIATAYKIKYEKQNFQEAEKKVYQELQKNFLDDNLTKQRIEEEILKGFRANDKLYKKVKRETQEAIKTEILSFINDDEVLFEKLKKESGRTQKRLEEYIRN